MVGNKEIYSMSKQAEQDKDISIMLIKSRMLERQRKIVSLHKDQADDLQDLSTLCMSHEARYEMEQFYLDALEIVRES